MAQTSIPLMRSTFFDEARTRELLAEFVKTAPRLSMGEQCAAFERAFAAHQGRAFAAFVCNGSAANLALIQSLLNLGRLKKGDKVGVSAVTWATNVMPLMQLGLTPVPIDCDVDNLNVTSTELAKHIADLRALFLTNALGFCADIDAVRSLCAEHDVLLLEDNCESLGSRFRGTLLGNFGLASTFSFFVGHHLSTVEGGMIATDDEELHRMLLMVRSHGWDRNLPPAAQRALREKENVDEFHARYTFHESAYNLRPTEIGGFLGLLQLPMLEESIDRRIRNFERFRASVAKRPDAYRMLEVSHMERISNFAMPVIARSAEILRSTVRRFEEAGVEVRPVIAGDVTLHPFWKKALPAAECPGARTIHACGFYFPNNPDLTDAEVDLLCGVLERKE